MPSAGHRRLSTALLRPPVPFPSPAAVIRLNSNPASSIVANAWKPAGKHGRRRLAPQGAGSGQLQGGSDEKSITTTASWPSAAAALIKGAAGSAALAMASGGALGAMSRAARAQANLRAEILKIPGVGTGSPTDADWQKVGEMCLGGTRETVQEGEFAGVELTFMGLNNQNQHNFLFRGFLKPWETYTGARFNWIDLAQADYNARLQQSIATGTVDFDVIEMGAPFEGDVCGKGLASEMPDWVAELIDMGDYVNYLKAPVGTWDGKTYRISIDGDCHTFSYRTDVFSDPAFAEEWKAAGNTTEWGPPTTWAQVQAASKFLAGKTDPTFGTPLNGFLDPLKGWGGFGFYFLEDRATGLRQVPGRHRPGCSITDTMKPRVNNPAFVRAIQDVLDAMDTPAGRPDQRRPEHHRLSASSSPAPARR